MPLPYAILGILWALWVVAAVLSVILVRKFGGRFLHWEHDRYEKYSPSVALIVPFRGVDLELEHTIETLCNQQYDNYRLICVVESEDDPAYPLLRDLLGRHPHRNTQLVVAGPADRHEGQKVHNLLRVIEQLLADDQSEEAWVFADSDTAPGPLWLRDLVRPLCRFDRNGVTTGYRWMVPTRRFWSEVASVINSSVACFCGYENLTHAWGGSMAMRRDVAVEGDFAGHLRGALSDDYQATRMCRRMGRRVYFVPPCFVASTVDFDRRSFFNFARRQYVITRLYAPWVYYRALGLMLMHVLGWISAWAALIVALAAGSDLWKFPAAAILVVFIANQFRAHYRKRGVRIIFGDAMVQKLRRALRLDRWATPLWLTIHLLVILSALGTRTIEWRGKRYRINGPQRVEQLD